MSSKKESSGPASKRNGVVRALLCVGFFTALAWLVVAGWGFSFWPSVALFTVYTVGVSLPLGLTLGLLIPWGVTARRNR